MHLTTSLVFAVLGASTALALPINEADSNAKLLRREPKRLANTGPGGPGNGLWSGQGDGGRLPNGAMARRDISDEPILERRKGRRGRGHGRKNGEGRMGGGDEGGDGQPGTQRRSLGEEEIPPAPSPVLAATIPRVTGAPHDLNSKEAANAFSHDLIPSVTDSAHPAEAAKGHHKNKSGHRKSSKRRGSKKHLSKHRDEETSSEDSTAEHRHGHHEGKARKHKHHKSAKSRKHKHHDEDSASDDESVGHHRKNRKYRNRKHKLQSHEGPEGVEHAEHAVHEHHEHEHVDPEHEVKHKSKHSGKHRNRKHKKVHPEDAQSDVVPAPPSNFEPPSQVVQQRDLQIDELD